MSQPTSDYARTDMTGESTATPFEAIPELAANEHYVTGMTRLRELKALKDQLFNDDEKKGPLGEFEGLKREMAAMQLVHGQKSVAYYDLRVMSADGGVTKGKITGPAMIEQYEQNSELPMPYDKLRAIALAATNCDASTLVQYGCSPSAVAAAREPDKPRANSIRVEWIGAKGRGADKKMRAGAGDVQ